MECFQLISVEHFGKYIIFLVKFLFEFKTYTRSALFREIFSLIQILLVVLGYYLHSNGSALRRNANREIQRSLRKVAVYLSFLRTLRKRDLLHRQLQQRSIPKNKYLCINVLLFKMCNKYSTICQELCLFKNQ